MREENKFINKLGLDMSSLFKLMLRIAITRPEQIAYIPKQIEIFRDKFLSIFFSFPGDEDKYGGCLSSCRGFIHINANGDVEPCPFSPLSINNVNNTSLEEALQSKFFKSIRENHHKLEESNGGCALWENQEWVKSLLQEHKKFSNVLPETK